MLNDQYLRLKEGGVARSVSKGSFAIVIRNGELYLRDFEGNEFLIGPGITTTSVTGTTYTALATDHLILADNAAGLTVTLPVAAIAGDGAQIVIKRVGATGTITIDGNGSETIDGGLTATLTTQYESITLVSDGSNWHII